MIRRLFLFATFALASTLALALPSVKQVEAEVAQGRYAQAETMMGEVVAAKPGSARAHYIYAEILAHNELFPRAAEQARLARTIDPSLAFAGSADKFHAFEQLLERAQTGAAARSSRAATPAETTLPPVNMPARSIAAAPTAASGVPSWLWGIGFAVVAVLLWRAVSRRPSASATGPASTGAGAMAPGAMAANSPYGPGGVPPAGMAPATRGGGLLGAGLAGAGGFAAGMMVDRMLHPDGGNRGADRLAGLGPDAGGNLDDPGSDLASRNVDFGSGGNDWGGDAGDAGGSSDGGGSGDGGGWDS